MESFTCSTKTVRAEDALRERLARIEARERALRELERYLTAVRVSDRIWKEAC